MISLNNISVTENIRKSLSYKGILLESISFSSLKVYLPNLKLFSKSEWNDFKKGDNYIDFLFDINELYELGYGNKFISLCLSIKYQIFVSHQIIQRIIKRHNRNRLSYSVNENIFRNSDISIKGRIFYSKGPSSNYLSFRCIRIKNLSENSKIGVKVFYDISGNKIFLERDDRSAKKLMVHSKDILVSLYPIPQDLRQILKNTEKTYKSLPVEVHLNSSDFSLKRSDLIDDYNAKLLYPELEKFGFSLPRERITNMSRSKGDLSIIKNNKRISVEITNLAQEIPATGKYQRDHSYRDKLIGKMIRLITLNDCNVVFILNYKNNESIINEDFKKIIKKYRINIIFTDFEKDWQISVARKITDLVEII